MGYCIDVTDSCFEISKEQHEKALAAIKALAGNETITDGSGPHFSWVLTQEFVKAKSLSEALKAWRWQGSIDEEGHLYAISFSGEKLGDDEMLFRALAPFVKDGSYIEFRGEDNAMWRYVFENGKMEEKFATVTWE